MLQPYRNCSICYTFPLVLIFLLLLLLRLLFYAFWVFFCVTNKFPKCLLNLPYLTLTYHLVPLAVYNFFISTFIALGR